MRKAKSKTGETTSSASRVEETGGETSAAYEESMSASLEDWLSAVSEVPLSHHLQETLLTTPTSCLNCDTLTKENRKLSNSIKTVKEATKKRRAEIKKLQKVGLYVNVKSL